MPLLTFARFCLFGYLFLVPWALAWVPNYSGHDLSRIVESGVMALCALAWAPSCWRRLSTFRSIGWAAYGALLTVFAVLAVVHADVPRWTLLEAALWAGMLAVAAVVAFDDHAKAGLWLAWTVIASSVAYNAMELAIPIIGLAAQIPMLAINMAPDCKASGVGKPAAQDATTLNTSRASAANSGAAPRQASVAREPPSVHISTPPQPASASNWFNSVAEGLRL